MTAEQRVAELEQENHDLRMEVQILQMTVDMLEIYAAGRDARIRRLLLVDDEPDYAN